MGTTLFAIVFIVMGCIQFWAIWDGGIYIGLPSLAAFFVAALSAWLPLVGWILGMLGAVYAWHWSWLGGFALFFGPYLVFAMILGVLGCVTWIGQKLGGRWGISARDVPGREE